MSNINVSMGSPEAIEFFKQLDEQIKKEELKKDSVEIRRQIKKDKQRDAEILDYCNEHELGLQVAKEIRDTQTILDEADKLDINNPFECMLYNQIMSGLDGAY